MNERDVFLAVWSVCWCVSRDFPAVGLCKLLDLGIAAGFLLSELVASVTTPESPGVSWEMFAALTWSYEEKESTGANSDPEEFEHCSKWQELKTCICLCGGQNFKASNSLVFARRPAFFHFRPVELRFSGFFFWKKTKTQLSHKRYLIWNEVIVK